MRQAFTRSRASVLLLLLWATADVAQERSSPAVGVSAKELAWQEFTAPDKTFKLMFPTKPAKQKIPGIDAPPGMAIGSYKATLGTLEFILMYLSVPYSTEDAQISKRLLDGGRDLAVADTRAQVLSETEIYLDDHPGRELIVKFPTKIMKARIVLIEQRIYTFGVTLPCDDSNQKVIQDAVGLVANRYFASFKKLSPKK